MFRSSILLFFYIFFECPVAMGQEVLNRDALHETAKAELYDTHFFENGRGMTIAPDLSIFLPGLNTPNSAGLSLLSRRYGFIPGKKRKLMGVFDLKYKGINIAVLGCTGCHSGRAAGITIPGLGNKTIDTFLIGQDTKRIQKIWKLAILKKIKSNPEYTYLYEKSMNFSTVLADKNISNLTRGLVPNSSIKTFFYKDMGETWGPEIERTQVKVPSLWGIKEKREVGIFADGSLNSQNYAWAFGAELFASDSGDHLRASMPKLKHVVENVLGNLLPPPYPFSVDNEMALHGKGLADNHCATCHGDHERDPEGYPVFEPPNLVEHDSVGTQDQRLNYGNQQWVDLAETGSVSDLIRFNRPFFNYGYFAPKLWGIWSRFPYLHNGSVPTLYHMMLPPEERPPIFNLTQAGEKNRFDPVNMGLTLYKSPKNFRKALRQAKRGNRNIYYIKRAEHGNEGHYFPFMKRLSEYDRRSLLEYLKTL